MKPNPAVGGARVLGVLHAYKAARILVGEDGSLAFAGAGLGTTYGAVDVASCVKVTDHAPPHPGCSCGYYAFRTRSRAQELVEGLSTALLDVELSGAFHEYEHGFVAAVQEVRRVTLQPYCWPCLAARDGRTRAAVVLAVESEDGRDGLLPVCDEHSGSGRQVLTIAALASAFGVPVGWAEDEDPLTEAMQALVRRLGRPRRSTIRRLDDLLPGEITHVFRNTIAQDVDGSLYINPRARLQQPPPGTGIPIRRNKAGKFEAVLDTPATRSLWRPRRKPRRFSLSLSGSQAPPSGR